MEIRTLIPRQLLVLLMTACRDSGCDTVPTHLVDAVLKELQFGKHPHIPEFTFQMSSMKPYCAEIREAMNALHLANLVIINPVGGTVTVTERLSCAEVYASYYDADRPKVAEYFNSYVSAFMGRLIQGLNALPDPRRDPRAS